MDDATDSFSPVSLGKLSVPVDLAYLRPVQAFTSDLARVLAYDESQTGLFQLAVEEAFTNAVKHFNRTPGSEENIHVEFALEKRDFVITIRDRGIPFAIDDVKSYETSGAVDADKPGLGLTLMKTSVDKVEVISAGGSGKEVRLIKRLPENATLPKHILSSAPHREKRRTPSAIIVREPTPADLPSIRRLAWRSYGYSYAPEFYDLEKLRAMYESGLCLPVIAIDKDTGEAIFHSAICYERPDSTVAEEAMGFSDPTIHAPDAVKSGVQLLRTVAFRQGLMGVYLSTVTSHTMSQKAAVDYVGTNPCTIEFALAKRELQPVMLPTSSSLRTSAICHFAPLVYTPATVHVPERHAPMIAEIYEWLKLPREISVAKQPPAPEKSDTYCSHSVVMNYSVINVRTIGKDCVAKIREYLTTERKNGAEVIYLRLASDSPAAPVIAEECERMGLTFAGILPFVHSGKDAIVLQWIGVPMDMDAIKIYGDKGRKLFDYVRACAGY